MDSSKQSKSEEAMQSKMEQAREQGKVVVKLVGGMGNQATFMVKPDAKVSKLLKRYCQDRGVSPSEYRMIYNGKVLSEEEPLSSYNFTDGQSIDVVASQTGGA